MMIIDLVPELSLAPCTGCIFYTADHRCCVPGRITSDCNGRIWVVVGPGREQSYADIQEDYLLQ